MTEKRSRGHVLTNFNRKQRPIYEKAIMLAEDSRYYIVEDAFDIHGRHVPGCNALHFNGKGDTSEFWAIFDEIKEWYK